MRLAALCQSHRLALRLHEDTEPTFGPWGAVDVDDTEEVKSKAFSNMPADQFAVFSQQMTQGAQA